jgi:hypothetical protein
LRDIVGRRSRICRSETAEHAAAALEISSSLKRRWRGETDGLTDTIGSGFDFSITALLKSAGLLPGSARRLRLAGGTQGDVGRYYLLLTPMLGVDDGGYEPPGR